MQKMFTKILVPVALNRNTHWSMDKAIQLANKFGCDILLLHVQPSPSIPFLPNSLTRTAEKDLGKTLKEFELQYRYKLNEGLSISSVSQTGYWHTVLKDVIISEHIDLVVIPHSNRRFGDGDIRRINISKLSQQTNCPVMTVTRNFNANKLQNIVVPIHDLLPIRKLTIATYLSLGTSGCIYLMGRNEHSNIKAEDYLMKAFQLLNEVGKLNIHCALQYNEDMASGALTYAKFIKANLIVVNPGNESRLRGWWNKLRGKYLSGESDIPVLTVAI